LLTRALVAGLLLGAALAAQAQQYRWVDEKGRVQYTDTPPPASAKGVQKKNLNTGPAAGSGPEPYALQLARKSAPVKLYSSPDCGAMCDGARALLNQRGVPFSEVSVADAAQLEEFKKVTGGTAVPVMFVGQSMQKGFEEGSYHRALDAAGYPAAGLLPPRKQAAPPPPKPPAEAPAAAPAPAPAEPGKPASQ
jgi:glutaredoxin